MQQIKGRTDRLSGRRNIETSSNCIDGISHGGEEQPGSREMPTYSRDV
jgi:hypothetical protein